MKAVLSVTSLLYITVLASTSSLSAAFVPRVPAFVTRAGGPAPTTSKINAAGAPGPEEEAGGLDLDLEEMFDM
jgi:hypothetical protein